MNHYDKSSSYLKEVTRRPPAVVMKPERLGSLFPNRLSFSRSLIRKMTCEKWSVKKELFDLDEHGIGVAIYKVETPQHPVWFVVFADNLKNSDRTDRVIAKRWDVTFVLTTEEPRGKKLRCLKKNVPLQEAGRCSSKEIILSRANKSVRLFDYVVSQLASGKQPSPSKLVKVGYLMRTTAVYGNGKFGLADFEDIRSQKLFQSPFQAEMLCVYLARNFSFDWVEEVARRRDPGSFCELDARLKRSLGVGNATGLGMAPFLVTHPKLISNWMEVREHALQRVRGVKHIAFDEFKYFMDLLEKGKMHLDEWQTEDPQQAKSLITMKKELSDARLISSFLNMDYGWNKLFSWSVNNLSIETQEFVYSMIIECYPTLVDEVENYSYVSESFTISAGMSLLELRRVIEKVYKWAFSYDFDTQSSTARFWYSSADKEEPRIGFRYREPGAEYELQMGIAFEVRELNDVLEDLSPNLADISVAEFLVTRPKYRGIISRVQTLKDYPYAEIQDNLIGNEFRPISLLRCKLAMFGATKFDPRSDLWIRITLFQGSPLAGEIKNGCSDNWAFPSIRYSC